MTKNDPQGFFPLHMSIQNMFCCGYSLEACHHLMSIHNIYFVWEVRNMSIFGQVTALGLIS